MQHTRKIALSQREAPSFSPSSVLCLLSSESGDRRGGTGV